MDLNERQMTVERKKVLRIDSMALARATYIRCRAYTDWAGKLLHMLAVVLPETLERVTLVVDVDAELVDSNDLPTFEPKPGKPKQLLLLSPQTRLSLVFCLAATEELVRLHETGSKNAVRSLGNALHNFPEAIANARTDSFNQHIDYTLRSAAPYWEQLSTKFREAFAEPLGLEQTVVEQLVHSEGFEINLYREEEERDD
jgi:hypothetical protein